MNDIVYTKSYTEYRNELLQELSNASESFVRIGYLLKVARDTEVLSGQYENYIDFAREKCTDATDGRMYFTVTNDGKPLRKRRYFYITKKARGRIFINLFL